MCFYAQFCFIFMPFSFSTAILSADSNVAHNELTFFLQTSPYLKSSAANTGLYYL